MKIFFFSILSCISTISCTAQDLVFKDSNFQKAILSYEPKIDLNGDGIIQQLEAKAVKVLRLMEKGIHFIDDAYLFPNLEELVLTNNEISEVKLVGCNKMVEFYCAGNQLTSVEVRDMARLKELGLNSNENLSSLTLINLPNLTSFSAESGQLSSLDVSIFPLLKYLSISENKISSLDIRNNPELIQVRASENLLKELDIRFNPKMETHILYVDDSVKLIATPKQNARIKKEGLGKTIILMEN